MVSGREETLKNFWEVFKSNHRIVLEDVEKLGDLMFKIEETCRELRLSREKWKARALKAELNLKLVKGRCYDD